MENAHPCEPWNDRFMNEKAESHLRTAKLLIEGIEESAIARKYNGWRKYYCPPEHSTASMIRRLIQARQELLIVMDEVRND